MCVCVNSRCVRANQVKSKIPGDKTQNRGLFQGPRGGGKHLKMKPETLIPFMDIML